MSLEQDLPKHLAIIMDGNGRWAKRRNLPRIEGHRRGADSVRDITRACRELGLQALTLYAFSSQNWDRPIEEVRMLMALLRDYLVDERAEILDNQIRLTSIGDVSRLPDFVREPLDALKADSANNQGMTLCLALSYGGREAIVDAARTLVERVQRGEILARDVNLLSFGESLCTAAAGLPPLDLVIRTSGEQRLSNFLLWEVAYAELAFTDTLWPDFRREELYEILGSYGQRERRFGLTTEQIKLRAISQKMSNLAARLLTAGALIPVLVACIIARDPIYVWIAVFTATAIALRELYNMTMQSQPAAERYFGVALGLGFAAITYWLDGRSMAVNAALAAITIASFLYYLFRFGAVESVAARVTAMLSGVLYCNLLTFLALLKKRGPDGGAWVFITLTCTWLSDTGAYFAGRFLGPLWPKKLYESVSPKKTIIGAAGGLAFSVGALVLAKLWYLPSLTWTDVFLIAVPANLLAQTGDLCESLLKRSVGVKDSGALLPGHGGMLDRIDALLFVVPYVYCYARWVYGRILANLAHRRDQSG